MLKPLTTTTTTVEDVSAQWHKGFAFVSVHGLDSWRPSWTFNLILLIIKWFPFFCPTLNTKMLEWEMTCGVDEHHLRPTSLSNRLVLDNNTLDTSMWPLARVCVCLFVDVVGLFLRQNTAERHSSCSTRPRRWIPLVKPRSGTELEEEKKRSCKASVSPSGLLAQLLCHNEWMWPNWLRLLWGRVKNTSWNNKQRPPPDPHLRYLADAWFVPDRFQWPNKHDFSSHF